MRRLVVFGLLVFGLLAVGLGGDALAQFRDSWAPTGGGGYAGGFPDPYAGVQTALFMTRLGIMAAPFILGLLIGGFFSPRLAAFRHVIFLLTLGVCILIALFGPTVLGWTLTFIIGFVGFFAGLYMAFVLFWPAQSRRRPTTFGSAEWADADHLRRQTGRFKVDGGEGFWLGEFPQPTARDGTTPPPIPLRYNGDRHLLTIAPTRAGKGVSAIVPNLLTYKGSALVIDPKGENALLTLKQRDAMGQRVCVVDPWGLVTQHFEGEDSQRFNPLDWLDPNDDDIAENAMLLADALVVSTGRESNPFWNEEAKALLMGLILYVATEPDEQHNRHLGRVRDLLLQDSDALKLLLGRMTKSDHPVVVGTGSRSLQKDAELLGNVLASTQAHTHFLDSPRIRESLSASDFSFASLKTEPMTVYLVLPADRLNAFSRWLRLLIQQAITVNARNIEEKPERPILFILDEMAALGGLKMVEQAFGLMAGFGMQLWGIVQDASQLKRLYGDGWETFISNAGVLQYFGSRDVMTAEYFPKLCGVTTVPNWSTSIANAISRATSGQGGGSSTLTNTTSEANASRHLAYADELMTLRNGLQLLLIENLNPIKAQKIVWYEHPELKGLGLDVMKARQALAAQASRPAAAPEAKPTPAAAPAPRPVAVAPAAAPAAAKPAVPARPRAAAAPVAAKPAAPARPPVPAVKISVEDLNKMLSPGTQAPEWLKRARERMQQRDQQRARPPKGEDPR